MKKILLIPSYHYLSNPVYLSLKDILDEEYEFIYYFTKDSCSIKGNIENISYDKVGKYFDKYIELNYQPIWEKRVMSLGMFNNKAKKTEAKKTEAKKTEAKKTEAKKTEAIRFSIRAPRLILGYFRKIKKRTIRFSIRAPRLILGYFRKIKKRTIRFSIRAPRLILGYFRKIKKRTSRFFMYHIYIEYINYVKSLLKKVEEVSPDLIITNSDMTLTNRIIKKYYPNAKLVVIQPCFIDFRERKLQKQGFKKKTLSYLLKGIMLPRQPYYGLEDTSNKLLLFEDKFMEFYKNKRDNLYRIYNPYFTRLYENITTLNKVYIKSKLSNAILDISKKPAVVIFIMDYSSMHGKNVQQYTEDSYKELVGAFENDFNFIIKNHPRAPALDFQNEIKSNKNVIFLKDEITYDELLAIGDLNISINSNASLESLVAGMPTVNFLPLDLKENEHFRWLSYYCDLEAHTYEDLDKILDNFIKDRETYMNKVKDAQQMLVGTREECKQSFLKAFEA